MGWPTSFSNSDDWTAIGFMQRFFDAVKERVDVIQPVTTLGSYTATAGTDVQNYTFIAQFQDWVRNNCIRFLVPPAALNANLTNAVITTNFTFATLLTAAGITTTDFRRIRPREIVSVSSTGDTSGNTIADGMIARNLTDVQAYTRVSGVWTLTPAATIDIIDSNNAAPNTVGPGSASIGDYPGAHIFTQLKACFNQMYVVSFLGAQRDPANTPDAGYTHLPGLSRLDCTNTGATPSSGGVPIDGGGTARSLVSFTDAVSIENAAWGNTITGKGGVGWYQADHDRAGGPLGPDIWDINAVNSTWGIGGTAICSGAAASNGPNISCDIYYYAFWNNSNGNIADPGFGRVFTFDTQGITDATGGTPVCNNPTSPGDTAGQAPTDIHTYMGKISAFNLSTAPASGLGGTVYLPLLGPFGGTSIPTVCADPGAWGSPAQYRGYMTIVGGHPSPALVSFKVTGGFVYV